jgi:hypothetical protein
MVSADWVKRRRREKRQAAVYQYQKDCRYFAQIADSLKEAGADELAELGAEDVRPEFSGINEGQQVNQLFKDKIDPLRHKLIRDLIKRVKVTGILLDIYKCQMPTFYKITSNFIKPKT